MRAAIIGGGLSGLAAALRMRRAGFEVEVFEADDRLGGRVRTQRHDRRPVELGPVGFLDTDRAMLELTRDVGLGGELRLTPPARVEALLVEEDHLTPLPAHPKALLRCPRLSLKGRARALRELFIKEPPPPAPPPGGAEEGEAIGPESVADFTARRFGEEAAERLIAPLVSAYAGAPPEALEMISAFPHVCDLVEAHGSFLKGAFAERRARTGPAFGPGGRLMTLREGMSDLIEALRVTLDGAVHLQAEIRGLTPYRNYWGFQANGEAVYADVVVLALPAPALAPLIAPLDAAAGEALGALRYMSLERLAMAFEAGEAPQPFGAGEAFCPTPDEINHARWSGAREKGAPFIVQALRHLDGPEVEPPEGEIEAAWLRRFGGALPEHRWRWIFPHARPRFTLGHAALRAQITERLRGLDGLLTVSDALDGARLEDLAAKAEALPGLAMRID